MFPALKRIIVTVKGVDEKERGEGEQPLSDSFICMPEHG